MPETVLLKTTESLILEAVPGNADLDTKVRQLLETEYLRRISSHRRIDSLMRQKYGMTFDQFLAHHVTARMNYSWEVESDAMEWETAVDGFETTQHKLAELRRSFNA